MTLIQSDLSQVEVEVTMNKLVIFLSLIVLLGLVLVAKNEDIEWFHYENTWGADVCEIIKLSNSCILKCSGQTTDSGVALLRVADEDCES